VNAALKIVIVEDDVLIAMDMAELLLSLGYNVCATACTEAQAVAAAMRHHPDLMIVDGNLAEGSGLSAVARIIEHGFVPHLFVTGDPIGMLEQAPGAVIVTKPFTMRQLSDGIARAMARSCCDVDDDISHPTDQAP
jgi:CheY-like chemotaxis protein